jgi:hypothetical protein
VSVYDLSVPRPPVIEPEGPNPQSAPSPAWTWGIFLLTAVGALLYVVGWLAGSILVPVLVGGRWVVAAIATGWDDASNSWRGTGRMEP